MGGGEIGLFTMDQYGNNQAPLLTDPYEACYPKEPEGQNKKRQDRAKLFPGIYGGIDTPNYSPDGNFIIFGYPGDNGINVYRINSNGTGCTMLYESEGSYSQPRPAIRRTAQDSLVSSRRYL